MYFLSLFLAALPVIVFVSLLLCRKNSLVTVSFIALVLLVAISVIYWRIYPQYLFASSVKGFLVALDIFLIIFGAVFFLEIMRETKIIQSISYYLESVSKDLRVQVIFLAWFFENFLEGTAGFGTPSTIVAPLLIGLGISPINSVIIALLGNSASVVFGAAGAPIKIGFGHLASESITLYASMFNLVGIFVPVFILWFITKNKINSKQEFWEALPFALWSGAAFAVPSVLIGFLGKEFPSILGSVIGLVLVLITTKLGFLVPHREKNLEDGTPPKPMPLIRIVFPYMLLIILLLVGKFVLGSAGFTLPVLIKHTFNFFNPGFAFLIAGIATIFAFKLNLGFFTDSLKTALKKSTEPFLVIIFMAIFSQIMVVSVNNYSGLPSMVYTLTEIVRNSFLPLYAPIVGAFGSFLTGSATVSNLMFGGFLAESAKVLGQNTDKILALAVVGGAAGNMIALADIITAETVVGIKNEERKILSGVIIPCLIYVLLVGIIGFLVLNF